MNVTLVIPDDLARRLGAEGESIERRALEAFALEEHRAGRVSSAELRLVLGFATRAALDEFLKARGIYDAYDVSDFEQDRAALDRLGL